MKLPPPEQTKRAQSNVEYVGVAPDLYGPVNLQVLGCWPFQGPARQSPDSRSAAISDG